MSQYNLKNEVDLNNQNLDGVSPRLAAALEKLHTAINELKKIEICQSPKQMTPLIWQMK